MLVPLFVYKFIFLKNEFHIVCFIFKRRVKRVLREWTSLNIILGSKCLTEPWNDKSSSRGGIRDFYNRLWYPKRVKWLTTNPSFIVRSLDFPSPHVLLNIITHGGHWENTDRRFLSSDFPIPPIVRLDGEKLKLRF